MKKHMQISGAASFLTALILISACSAKAQSFTNLHTFAGSDGSTPYGELIFSGNTLFGTTKNGGSGSQGTVFRINKDGTGFTNIHHFTATGGPLTTNLDGANPYAGLLLVGDTLYGTAPYGGPEGNGTVFKLKTDGSGFTVLHAFPSPDHGEPYAGLILSGDRLYGATGDGGTFGWGAVYSIKTNGTGFTNLHSFTFEANEAGSPYATLTLSGGTLYGTTIFGGTNAFGYPGTVFKVNTNGTGYTNLYNFTGDADGSGPQSALVLIGNVLYGTCQFGGSTGQGDVFRVNTDGSSFTNLHSFTGGFNEAYTMAGLAYSGGRFFGTTYLGGLGNAGTVFCINPDGTGFTNLYHFGGAAGARLWGAVVVDGNTIYGTASEGGSGNNGTIFSITLPTPPVPPSLSIQRAGTNVVLTWSTNSAGFNLRSTTNLLEPITWNSVTPSPVIVNGLNTVTNPSSGSRKFYQLIQ